MKRGEALALAAGALALSGCQTTGSGPDYVKVAKGPELEIARAQCKAYAARASHVVIGIGGPEVIVGALIGTAIATGVRRAYVFEHCMAAQGYQKAGAKGAIPPTPQPSASPTQKAPPPAKGKARAG